MSDSELDPHVLISCRAAENPKIVDLPNDRARWGWLILMGKAKLQRPAGRFASERVVAAVLGEHRRFLADYLRVGILEPEADLCADCAQVIPPDDRRADGLAVHDWTANQSRTQRWRRKVGLTSGHGNLTGTSGETNGETSGKQPRAGARVMQSHSPVDTTKEEDGTEGGPGGTERDAAVALHERTGTFPTQSVIGWLNELAEAHSEDRLVSMIDRTPMGGRNLRAYLVHVRDLLRAEDHFADRAEREAERRRAVENRRPTAIRRRPEDISDEEAERIARQYREGATA